MAIKKFQFDTSDFEPLGNYESFDMSDFEPVSSKQSSSIKMPAGLNVVSGLMSLAGRSPEEKNIIANLPQVISHMQPGTEQQIEQGLGEYLPFMMTGANSLSGLKGVINRIAANALYGGALNQENIPEGLTKGLETGIAGEVIPASMQSASKFAEYVNPVKFTKNVINSIFNNHANAKIKMEENFNPLNEKYGESIISVTPENYLKNAGIKRSALYPIAKTFYDNFISEPNYGNLQKLKSQIGTDWASISNEPSRKAKSQLFNRYQNKLDSKTKSFLSRDSNDLSEYEKANAFARNEYYPYLSNKNLRLIASGKIKDLSPNKLLGTLESASQKEKSFIPEYHYINQAKNALKQRINEGETVSNILPSTIKGYLPNIVNWAQNPIAISATENAKPFYNIGKNALIGMNDIQNNE